MQLTELMAGGALAVSLLALVISLQSSWPQIREWAEDFRDTVLWLTLVAVLAGVGWFGWKQYEAGRPTREEVRPVSQVEPK